MSARYRPDCRQSNGPSRRIPRGRQGTRASVRSCRGHTLDLTSPRCRVIALLEDDPSPPSQGLSQAGGSAVTLSIRNRDAADVSKLQPEVCSNPPHCEGDRAWTASGGTSGGTRTCVCPRGLAESMDSDVHANPLPPRRPRTPQEVARPGGGRPLGHGARCGAAALGDAADDGSCMPRTSRGPREPAIAAPRAT